MGQSISSYILTDLVPPLSLSTNKYHSASDKSYVFSSEAVKINSAGLCVVKIHLINSFLWDDLLFKVLLQFKLRYHCIEKNSKKGHSSQDEEQTILFSLSTVLDPVVLFCILLSEVEVQVTKVHKCNKVLLSALSVLKGRTSFKKSKVAAIMRCVIGGRKHLEIKQFKHKSRIRSSWKARKICVFSI
ncbi:PREDICTED: uncharacterized protein LOC104761523 [Camelina sativa]|uniref:Uncharacterized protein LOC104761523 n=1 Tax=Camelina sativa TaxID=90675 RepID=A0ABM0XA45_CAMSA|nr:PREDICTED: uncharacterized protein LOC104761523 [Camelina sativa]